jgi:serine/threonine-protein kinase RsbT
VVLSVVQNDKRRGIQVVARDDGPGIENVELALQDGYTSGGGLGLGLPGARRLVHEFAIETALGHGTKVTMVMWERENARAV